MKKLLVFSMVLVSFVSYGQTTIGGVASVNIRSSFDANYGGWIDFPKWGLDYLTGAALSGDNPSPYYTGKSSKYTAGYYYRNYGLHKNYLGLDGYYYSIGGGIQNVVDMTTSGDESKILPYFNFGVGHRFSNDTYFLKGQINIGKVPSVGFGFGIVLK